jgi:membrane associated rhomboid family serine protease
MASDRFYMRNDYERPRTTMLVWIVSAITAAFVLQLVLGSPKLGSAGTVLNEMVLTIPNIQEWQLWTLLTHSLLHDTGSFWHILFTVLGLVFAGRQLEPLIGSRRFLALYVSSIAFSGLCWCAVHWTHGGAHIGAGAAIFAFLMVLSEINAGTEMMLFFFPVSFRLRHIIWVIIAFEVLALLFYEIPGAAVPLGLSPSTHLGGLLAGWLFHQFVHADDRRFRWPRLSLPSWLRPRSARPAGPARRTPAANAPWRSGNLRADVDRILDKINSHGFGSLSDEEKQILDDAKDLLSKH